MIPLSVDVPMQRLPVANWALIAVTVVVSLLVPYQSAGDYVPSSNRPGAEPVYVPGRFSPLVLGGPGVAPYQFVTYLFQHAGLLHLAGNMLFLFLFGNALNAKLGHIGFLAAYLGTGAIDGALWRLVSPAGVCVGASGAIMGLCGMFLVLYPRNTVTVYFDEFLLFRTGTDRSAELPGWLVVVLYLLFDTFGLAFNRSSNVAYGAHIIGGLLGAGLAVGLLRAGYLKPDPGEHNLLQWLAGDGPTERRRRRR
jgi:membrane associated rhomboid family serine protease